MPTALPIAALCTLCLGVAIASPPPGATAAAPPTPDQQRTPLDHARTLPVLPIVDGVTTIPLGGEAPMQWRPIREGITVAAGKGGEQLTVSYTRTRGQPAGAVLLVRPGTLEDLKSIAITASGNRAQTLSLTLTQADGSVWTVGPINVRPGEPREVTFLPEDVELDPFQNRGRPAASFDPASVYMLTFLDIAGYMSTTEPECEWIISSFKAVRR